MAYPPLIVTTRVKKRKRAEPIPRNAFPHVVEKVGAVIQNIHNSTNPLPGSCYRFRGQGVVQHVNWAVGMFGARILINIRSFFAGCHLFIPLFDPSYDTYESLMERTPWTFDAILAVAGKIRSGNGPLSQTFYRCLEEAQGIARSSLFGPVVRKEAVQGQTS